MPEIKINRYANVQFRFEGSKMVIEIETDEEKVTSAPSKSGKTQVIATTGGATTISGEGVSLKLNLTLYRPLA